MVVCAVYTIHVHNNYCGEGIGVEKEGENESHTTRPMRLAWREWR